MRLRAYLLAITLLVFASFSIVSSRPTRPTDPKKIEIGKQQLMNSSHIGINSAQDTEPVQHAPNAGKERCHNYKKNGKKPNCKCWGQYHPDYEKCPPPPDNGEDRKCTNYCRRDMCDCKIKCTT